MKKYIYLLLFIIGSYIASAQTPAFDKFNYVTTDTLRTIETVGTKGDGWNGPWTALKGNTYFEEDSIVNFNNSVLRATSKNLMDLDLLNSNNTVRAYRGLETPYLDNGQTYWLGYWARTERTGGANVNQIMLCDTSAVAASGGNGQLVGFGVNFDNDNIQIDRGTGTRNTGIASTSAHWIVAKIITTGDATDDQILLFVDPTPGIEPNDVDADASVTVNTLNSGWNGVFIKHDGPQGIRTLVDNLYIGNTFAEITPDDLYTLASPAFDQFNYATTDTLRTIEAVGMKGDGWNGPWTALKGNTYFQEDSIANFSTSVLRATSQNVMDLDLLNSLNTIRAYRGLETPYLDNGQTYWLGYWAQTERTGGANVNQIMLCDTSAVAASGGSGQLVGFGVNFDNDNIQIDRGTGTRNTMISGDVARWIVAKIITTGDASDDRILLFVDPTPGVEPNDLDADADVTLNTLNSGWNGVFIKHDGPQGLRTLVDNLYIGNTFEDITPDDLSILSNAPTPAFDQFNYATTDTLRTTETVGTKGDGWNGPWTALKGNTYFSEDSIVNFEYSVLKATRKNAMDLDLLNSNNTIRAYRGLETPYEDNGLTYWLGYWADSERTVTGNVNQIMLCDTSVVAASGGAGQLVGFGINFSNNNIQIDRGTGTSDSGIPGDTARWIVAKIITSGDASDEQILLFVDPTPGEEPDDSEAVADVTVNTLNSGWNGIFIKHDGPQGLRTIVDNLYIGNSFSEITPDDLEKVFPPNPPEVAFDKFDYSVGASLTDSTSLADEGSGWNGPWVHLKGGITIVEDSIESQFNLKGTVANAMEWDLISQSTGIRAYREFETPYLDAARTYWLGYWAKTRRNGGANVSQLVLADVSEVAATGGAGQLLSIGIDFDSDNLKLTGGTAGNNLSEIEGDTTHWIVAKIVTTGDNQADSVYLFADPAPGSEPSVSQAIASTSTTALADGFDGLMIKHDGPVGIETIVDDLYIGNSFADITPGDLRDVEQIFLPTAGYEGFNFTAGSSLDGAGVIEDPWATTWMKVSGDDATLNAESLDNSLTVIEGGSVTLSITDGEKDTTIYDRKIRPTLIDGGGSIWVSFLMESDDFQVTKSSKLSLLNGSEELIGFGGAAGLSTVGVTWNGASKASDVEVKGTNWIVAKIELSGDANGDTVYVWINPEPSIPPQDELADIVVDGISSDEFIFSNFDGIRLSFQGFTPSEATFDEIRFGFSFSDISRLEEEVDPDLIAQDIFAYSEGPLVGQGFTNEQWNEGWQSVGTEEVGLVTSGALEVGSLGIKGKSNKVTLTNTNGNVRYGRELLTPVTDDGNAYWLSAFMDFGEGSSGGGNVGQVYLWNTSFESPQDQRLAMGRVFGSSNGFLGMDDRASGRRPISDVQGTGSYWLVMKVQMSGDPRPDSAYLWINPDPELADLDTATADVKIASESLNDGFNGIFIKSEGAPSLTTSFDDIRFGSTYTSVTLSTSDAGPVLGLQLDEGTFVNYPNPFAESTTISFDLEESSETELKIISMDGRLIKTLASAELKAGRHQIEWNGINESGGKVAPGIYMSVLRTEGKTRISRIILSAK